MTLQGISQVASPQFDPAEDIFHGTRIIDPYRILEDRDSETAKHWIARQYELHDAYFSKLNGLDLLRERISKTLDTQILDQPTETVSRQFFRRSNNHAQQPSIYMSDLAGNHETLLVDPSPSGPFVSVAIHRISDDGSLLAYEVKHGGTDTSEIKFINTAGSEALSDVIPEGYPRGLAFTADNRGYCYCHDWRNAASDDPHEIRCHKFGTSADQDRTLFRAPRTPRSRLVLIQDRHNLGAVWMREDGSEMVIDFYLAPRAVDECWRPIFRHKTSPYAPFLEGGRIFVYSQTEAANGKIVELNDAGSELRVIVPETNTQIQSLSIADGRIYVCYMSNIASIVRSSALSGGGISSLEIPENSTVSFLPSYSNCRQTLFYASESFTDPPRIMRYCPQTREQRIWAQHAASTAECIVKKTSYPSKDGTNIPIAMLTHKNFEQRRGAPVLMTAYGGFGISMTPKHSVLVRTMVDLGALFVLPNIRGGREFGVAWHDAARRRNRQTAYDDFIAAAEWLCERGLTNPERLGIFGGSNSGLLVGVAMTQRPNLFRAVLCIAPILDMVRYQSLGRAANWEEEYGTVEHEADFAALYAYSPYHRVEEDVNYPATLFVCGGKDDRCSPAHVWKMSARLQLREGQTNPILVDYNPERGHSAVMPLSTRVESLTRRVAFLCHELGISFGSGAMS